MGRKSYGSLVQHDERSVIEKKIAFFTPQNFSFTPQLSLEKVHTSYMYAEPNSDEERRGAEEVTYGFSRGFKTSDQAELAYLWSPLN